MKGVAQDWVQGSTGFIAHVTVRFVTEYSDRVTVMFVTESTNSVTVELSL